MPSPFLNIDVRVASIIYLNNQIYIQLYNILVYNS